MAYRKDGKLRLTHAEQALSKIMGDVVRLPRRGAPKEPNLSTKSRIRVRHVDAGIDSAFGAVLDCESERVPTLYINTRSKWGNEVPLVARLHACDVLIQAGGIENLALLRHNGGCAVRSRCLFCPYTTDDAKRQFRRDWRYKMMMHCNECFYGRFNIICEPYTKHAFHRL